jgi:WD40 repeat protein
MSRHNIGVTPVPGQSPDELIPLPQQEGLEWASLYLSPDAKTLAAVTASRGRAPSYIHQIDLASGDVVSLLVAENHQWQIPLVEGRIPDILKNIRPGYEEYAAALALLDFPSLQWAPDSRGFIFTIQTLTNTPPAQIYYVTRYSTEAIPLASDSPGTDIGMFAQISPSGKQLVFPRFDEGELWIVDFPEAREITILQSTSGLSRIPRPIWSPDEQHLAVKAGLPQTTIGDLYLVDIKNDKLIQITDFKVIFNQPEDRSTVLSIQWLPDQSGMIYYVMGPAREYDAAYYVDINTKQTSKLSKLLPAFVGGYDVPSITISPIDHLAVMLYGDPCSEDWPADPLASNIPFHFQVISVPDGDMLFESTNNACLSIPAWSPDGHLIAGHSEDEIVIWDLDSGESTIVAPELEGRNIFLGWDPDPEERN